MDNGQHQPQSFPDLRGGVVIGATTWVCAAGHEQRGAQPFRLPITQTAPQMVLLSGPMCPVCYGDWLGQQFAVTKKTPEPGAEDD